MAGRVGGLVVDAYPTNNVFVTTTTKADGSYTFLGLAPGAYKVCVYPYQSDTTPPSANQYINSCYHDDYPHLGAPNLPLTAAHLGTGIDIRLSNGGAIKTTVTDTAGHPLTGVVVRVDNFAGTSTGADGVVTTQRLEQGVHTVCLDAGGATGGSSPGGYVDQCYNGVPVGGTPTKVPVTTGKTTSITARLAAAG